MKFFPAITIVLALFWFLLATTTIAILSNIGNPIVFFDFNALLRGNYMHLWFYSEFWQVFPGRRIHFSQILGGFTNFAIMGSSIAAIVYYCRSVRDMQWTTIGWICFLASAIPFLYAKYHLSLGVPAHQSGRWLAIMIQSQIYGSLACVGCAAMEFVPPMAWLQRRTESIIPVGSPSR